MIISQSRVCGEVIERIPSRESESSSSCHCLTRRETVIKTDILRRFNHAKDKRAMLRSLTKIACRVFRRTVWLSYADSNRCRMSFELLGVEAVVGFEIAGRVRVLVG